MAGAPLEVVHWHCGDFSEFTWREWEEEIFLFNPGTGQTHILNDASWQVLRHCARKPSTEAELLQCLSGDDNQELHLAVEQLLTHLCRLGLVVALSPR